MSDSSIFLTGDKEKDTNRITYVIFISAVAILAFVVAILYYIIPDPEISQVLRILDFVYAMIFLVDFILRFRHTSDRKHYMLHWGWLDLVTCIPGIPAFRIIRSIFILRNAREIMASTPDEIADQARGRIAESVLFVTVFVGLIVITVGSVMIVWVEADAPGAKITTGADAMWWSLVTVSTVGYGDEYPVTAWGRVIGVFMISVGVALFTTITSYLASNFTDRGAKQQRDQQIALIKQNAANLEAMIERMASLEEQIAEKEGIEDPGDGEDSG